MFRFVHFVPYSLPFVALGALYACGDDAGQSTSPIGVACVPSSCGDVPEHSCPSGQDSPIECLRGDDGSCSWQVGDCPDEGRAGAGQGGDWGSASGAGDNAGSAGTAGDHNAAGSSSGAPGGSPAPAAGGSGAAAGGGGAGGAAPGPGRGTGGRLAPPPPAGRGGGGPGGGRGAGSGGAGSGNPGPGGGDRCGTRGGATCDDAQFCNFAPDAQCGAADRGGACADRPQVCPQVVQPVCGCDNRTHSNACIANSSGISVRHDGDCTAEECASAGGRVLSSNGGNAPQCAANEESWSVQGGVCCVARSGSNQTCGGFAALDCAGDEFCNFEESAGGQGCDGSVADAAGVCETRPTGCTREFNPVCSCDKHSFNNTCLAHSEGASILHEGGCDEEDCDSVGGHVVFGTGPAPMCPSNERQYTFVVEASGMSIEGAICCVP